MTEFPESRLTLLVEIKSPENREAWEAFVDLYRPVIYRMARRRGLQDADAQDLSQEVLVRVARAIDRYEPRPGIRFRHWLRRVARNAITSALTRQAGRDAWVVGDDVSQVADEPIVIEATNELDGECQREQYLRAAARVSSEVNQETWDAFELTVVQGMTCEAAAQVLGKSLGVIYAGRSRIMKRLRGEVERIQRDDS